MYMRKKVITESAAASRLDQPTSPIRRKITAEFKLIALRRMREEGITPTALAIELGVRRNQLYKWAKAFDEQLPGKGFKNPGRPVAPEETEVEQLRRKLAAAEEELVILKKFDAYLTRRKQ